MNKILLSLLSLCCACQLASSQRQTASANQPAQTQTSLHSSAQHLLVGPEPHGQQLSPLVLNLVESQHNTLSLNASARWIFALPTQQPRFLILTEENQGIWLSKEQDQWQQSKALLPPGLDFDHPIDLYWDGQTLATASASQTEKVGLMQRPPSESAQCQLKASLIQASSIYPHGVFGQSQEPTGLQVSKLGQTLQLNAPAENVFETYQAQILDDCSLLLTQSHLKTGAQLVLFSKTGEQLAQSDAIGTGFRWFHQVGATQLGPDLPREIVAVRTPHIGGILELYQQQGQRLKQTAALEGYSSHSNRTGNLNMVLMANWDNDPWSEILIPTQDMRALALIERTNTGLVETQRYEIPARLHSNLKLAQFEEHSYLLAGLNNGELLIWRSSD